MKSKSKKPRMGRPPKPSHEKCCVQITVYVTKEERAKLDKEAERLNVSLSELLMRSWREKSQGKE